MAYRNGKWEPNGFYGYKKPDLDIKTKFTIEYTYNQDVFDRMDVRKNNSVDNGELKALEFEFLEDALEHYIPMLYNDQCLYVMLFADVVLNGENVLEQSKSSIRYEIGSYEPVRKLKEMRYKIDDLESKNEKLKAFLKKYNVNPDEVLNDRVA